MFDFELRGICDNPNGLVDYWEKYKSVIPALHQQQGDLVITVFDKNVEIKRFLLLLKMLIPANCASRDITLTINKLIEPVMVH